MDNNLIRKSDCFALKTLVKSIVNKTTRVECRKYETLAKQILSPKNHKKYE